MIFARRQNSGEKCEFRQKKRVTRFFFLGDRITTLKQAAVVCLCSLKCDDIGRVVERAVEKWEKEQLFKIELQDIDPRMR